MATEFKKLSEVTTLESVADTAHVLVEENGEIYRAPKTSVGGAGGVKTAIIRDSQYLNRVMDLQQPKAAPMTTYECINMTFEEAYETMASGEPLTAIGMVGGEGAEVLPGLVLFGGAVLFGVPAIMITLLSISEFVTLYWTAEGLSTESPYQPS